MDGWGAVCWMDGTASTLDDSVWRVAPSLVEMCMYICHVTGSCVEALRNNRYLVRHNQE